jgi:tRNA-dihydrouridine synthase B
MSTHFWEETITVGKLQFPRFMAAPMDGITDSPFRRMIRKFSPEILLFGEICHISATAHTKGHKRLRMDPVEHPICYQVSANRLDSIELAVEKIVEAGFDMLNLNAGCPAKNVVKSGSGSALMADLPRMKTILTTLRESLSGRIPLTLKIRSGFKAKNAYEVAMTARDEGVEMIIIHPRTQSEKFSGKLDYAEVAKIVKALDIPVVFSGNICSFDDAQRVHELTGVAGFMIGRALIGAPWKIKEMMGSTSVKPGSQINSGTSSLSETTKSEVSQHEAIGYALEHLRLNIEFYGDHGFQHFKAQLPNYIRDHPHSKTKRVELLQTTSYEQMHALLMEMKDDSRG